jgi:flagellar hook-basal body complex protein FliE
MMKMTGIDTARIDAMVAQLRAAAAKMEGGAGAVKGPSEESGATGPIDFASALQASINKVSDAQLSSQKLGRQFAMGDDNISLSDVMISMQKASIAFQTTVQVRNKLVSAYHDIMNMQI